MPTPREVIVKVINPMAFDPEVFWPATEDSIHEADAIIAALRNAGYRIVPEEPTEAMIEAGEAGAWPRDGMTTAEALYCAMLAAAEGEGK